MLAHQPELRQNPWPRKMPPEASQHILLNKETQAELEAGSLFL